MLNQAKRHFLTSSLLFSTITATTLYHSNTIGYEDENRQNTKQYDLLLAGGGLSTCSSMALKNCSKNIFSAQQKSETLYEISQKNLQKLQSTLPFQQLSTAEKEDLNSALVNIKSKSSASFTKKQHTKPAPIFNYSALSAQFKQHGFSELLRNLPDPAYYALLDSLEKAQVQTSGAQKGQRKQEAVSLQHNKNTASVDVYHAFVAQAKLRQSKQDAKQKPLIAVVTASARDPYEVADFYVNAFNSAGANTLWLPLDATYQQARHLQEHYSNGCDNLATIRAQHQLFYREYIYPDRTQQQYRYCKQPTLMLDDIKRVQGIFFNGGDQSLTLAALLTATQQASPELQLIKQRMNAGELIVGGTSAGTAVQAGGSNTTGGQAKPVAMLSNGHSRNAMPRGAFGTPPPSQRCNTDTCIIGLQPDDLTYRAQGGTGLFSLGLLDTHFSERNRETRLAMFAANTQQRLAFGVDEATALLVRKPSSKQTANNQAHIAEFNVIGAQGVFIVDSAPGHLVSTNNKNDTKTVELAATAHFLNTGSSATFDTKTGKWQFALAGTKATQKTPLAPLKLGDWRDQTRMHCGTSAAINWQQYNNLYRLTPTQHTHFYIASANTANIEQCSYTNLPFTINYQD